MGEFTDALRRNGVSPPGDPSLARPFPSAPAPSVEERPARQDRLAIPRDKQDPLWVGRAIVADPHDPAAERFRHTAVQIRPKVLEAKPAVLLVSSAQRGDGKTTIACNLALALAEISAGTRVALLDLDLRRASVANVFGCRPEIGIESVLAGDADLSDAALHTDLPGLDIYPVASTIRNAHESLSDPVVSALFQRLTKWYGLVICDTPPILPVPDAALLAAHAGCCLLVARAGTTRLSALQDAKRLLPQHKLIGAFLNDATISNHHYGYSYSDRPEVRE